MAYDLIIRNGQVVLPDEGVRRLDLLVADGTIQGLVTDARGIEAREVIDAGGLHVLPGAIDPHVHLAIYLPAEEEWYSETSAAAQGGVTTLIDFFFHKDSYFTAIPAELDIARRRAVIDYAFSPGVLHEAHVAEMERCVREFGTTSFKFTGHWKGAEKTRIGLDSRIDDGLFYQTLERSGQIGGLVLCVHSQNVEISWPPFAPADQDHYLRRRHAGAAGLDLWEKVNPGFTETEYVVKTLYLARLTKASPYFVHISSKESAAYFREVDLGAAGATAETCTHYLGLTVDAPAGNLAKVNPPVRRREDQDALWAAIADGRIRTIGTDHCAAKLQFKQQRGDVLSAKLGFPGMSTFLPVLLSAGVRDRGLPIERVAAATSLNTAKVYRLYPRKGTIAVGSDADLVLVDMTRERPVVASELLGASDFSAYDGMRLVGWPVKTLVRGQVVFDQGKIVQPPGFGQYLRRA